jgi:small multidrug resistance family-3 protein
MAGSHFQDERRIFLSEEDMDVVKSVVLFIFAGLFEIGGAYLVWGWLREGKGLLFGLLGMAVLCLYGVVQTIQVAEFGRVFAAYGGIFIVMALLWGYFIDKKMVDRFDIAGAAICLAGATIIMFWPRT